MSVIHSIAECDQLLDACRLEREAADEAGDDTAVESLGLALDALLDERLHIPQQR